MRDKVAILEAAFAEKRVGDVIGVYSDVGGHALLPYAIEYPTPDVAKIMIYDSNWPGQERFITVDMAADTWTFPFSGPDPANDPSAWTGGTKDFDIAPYDARIAGTCPFCEGDTTARQTLLVIRSVAADWSVETPEGTLTATSGDIGEATVRPMRSSAAPTIADAVPINGYLLSIPARNKIGLVLPSLSRVTGITDSATIQIDTPGTTEPVEVDESQVSTNDPGTVVTLADGNFVATANGANNTVVTWGNNREGQLGTGTPVGTADRYVPTAISGVSLNGGESITSIDMSSSTGMVFTSQGRLFTWGSNKYRVLGIDKTYAASITATTAPNSTSAVLASRIAPTGASIVAAMFEHFGGFIIDSNGAVWTWGYAGKSLTGRGVAGPATTATGARFYPLSTATSARIALMDSTYWGMATVMSDGSLWTMGSKGDTAGYYYNADGTSTSRYAIGRIDLPFGPDTASPTETITQLSCGTYHCLIATSAGKIYGWGDSTYRSIVINGSTDITTPTLVASGLVNPRIAAGTWFSLYVDIGASGAGGTVYAYGANTNRRAVPQVSTSPLTSATAVQDMITPTGTPSDIVAISAGTAHAVALRANGALMTWGSNKYGQLGNGTNTTTVYYAEPVLPSGKIAASVHAAGNHTIVRATDGTLVGWGSNLNNVLAGASSGSVLSPSNIAAGFRFSQVDTYGYDASAPVATAVGITTAGAVMSWGSNQYGQLGRTDRPAASSGPNLNSSVPVAVQTSDGAPLVNADKVVATGYWGAAFRTATSPQVSSAPLAVTADSPEASKVRAFWSPTRNTPRSRGLHRRSVARRVGGVPRGCRTWRDVACDGGADAQHSERPRTHGACVCGERSGGERTQQCGNRNSRGCSQCSPESDRHAAPERPACCIRNNRRSFVVRRDTPS